MPKLLPLLSLFTLSLVACDKSREASDPVDSAADSVADGVADSPVDSVADSVADSPVDSAEDSADDAEEPAQDPCDPASEYTLRSPYPFESAWDAMELLPYAAPEIALLTDVVGTMQFELADVLEMEAALGRELDPDCELVEEGGSQVYRGDCDTTMGSAFSGELAWSWSGGGLSMSADDFEYHSYLQPLYFAADGSFTFTDSGSVQQLASALDMTVLSQDRWLSYRQDVCTRSEASGNSARGYVHLGLTDGFAMDHDFLVDQSMSYDADGAPVETIALTGSAVILLRRDASTTPCWAVELDGEAQEEFCG